MGVICSTKRNTVQTNLKDRANEKSAVCAL